jgi:hypothetical protein
MDRYLDAGDGSRIEPLHMHMHLIHDTRFNSRAISGVKVSIHQTLGAVHPQSDDPSQVRRAKKGEYGDMESDTDEEYGQEGYYDPRQPTDCFAGYPSTPLHMHMHLIHDTRFNSRAISGVKVSIHQTIEPSIMYQMHMHMQWR